MAYKGELELVIWLPCRRRGWLRRGRVLLWKVVLCRLLLKVKKELEGEELGLVDG